MELEKEDILQNYRDACMQIERLESTIETITQENKDLYNSVQNVQKEVGGASYQLAEMEKKEENYVQEILTLERHIDHVTRQLEDVTKQGEKIAQERDQVFDELNTFKNISNNQESNKTELQRIISRLENDKIS